MIFPRVNNLLEVINKEPTKDMSKSLKDIKIAANIAVAEIKRVLISPLHKNISTKKKTITQIFLKFTKNCRL